MARRSLTSGVRAKGMDRIEFEFTYQGKRYRPTIRQTPTRAHLRRARAQLDVIDRALRAGTFDFAREFPNYRLKSRAPQPSHDAELQGAGAPRGRSRTTCNDVFTAFLSHCEARVAMSDLAYSTFASYRQILNSVWRPRIGTETFLEVRFSRLQSILARYAARTEHAPSGRASDETPLKKKTYNNIASAVRCAFEYGYQDHLDQHNPALRLKTLRITRKDRDPVDPFTIQEGEAIIARSHAEFGEAHGNYEEFRLFTGLRQSEQFALLVTDYDQTKGTLAVRRARVRARDKDRTKTSEDREIALCPRAQAVLERQLALRARMIDAGQLSHAFLFFQADGAPLSNLSYPYKRWRYVLEVEGVRYREPYNARHSFVSWSLMVGKNVLKLAQEDGHSVQTMLSTYAAWTKDATETDVALIRHAMEHAPCPPSPPSVLATIAPALVDRTPASPTKSWGRLSWRKLRHAASRVRTSPS